MPTSRRNWLKSAAIIGTGLCLPGLKSIASPTPGPFKDGASDPIRLSSNENPYGPSPRARLAMAESIGRSNRYQWKMIRTLKEAIAERNGLTDAHVLVGAGSTQIIDACVQLAAQQKGDFITAEPTFNRWKNAAISNDLAFKIAAYKRQAA